MKKKIRIKRKNKPSKGISLRSLIILIMISMLICISAVSIFYNFYIIDEVKTGKMDLTVGEVFGFNLDTDMLHFGIVPPEVSSTKIINVLNNKLHPLLVYFKARGDFKDWVYFDDNYFILSPNETKEARVHVTVPSNAEYGNYTGTYKVIFKRVLS